MALPNSIKTKLAYGQPLTDAEAHMANLESDNGQGWITNPNGSVYLVNAENQDRANVDALSARSFGYQNQQLGVGEALRNTTLGAGYQGQVRNAAALEAMAGAPTGPSAAELAMRQQSGQAMQQNLAMAASGTGASNASLALNAMNRNAMQQGALAQSVGVQRAQEDQARRAQQMAALQGAGAMYGQAGQFQQNAIQGQANIMGNVAGQNNQVLGTYAGVGQANQQNALGVAQMKQQQDQYDSSRMDKYIGGAASAAGGMLAMSDIRAKTNIQPAQGDISSAFGNLSGSSYGYTDPQMGTGTHYGPMAQELAQTPAGASAVVPTQNGLAVDAGRLAMMNASETGRQRRELDALKSQITGTTSGAAVSGPVLGYSNVAKTGATLDSKDSEAEKKKRDEAKRKAAQGFGGALSAFGDAIAR